MVSAKYSNTQLAQHSSDEPEKRINAISYRSPFYHSSSVLSLPFVYSPWSYSHQRTIIHHHPQFYHDSDTSSSTFPSARGSHLPILTISFSFVWFLCVFTEGGMDGWMEAGKFVLKLLNWRNCL